MNLNNMIVMNRGDSYEFTINIIDLKSEYSQFGQNVEFAIYFGLMDPNQPFEYALLRKKYTVADIDSEGNVTIKLTPEDTIDLMPGKYYYAIKSKLETPTDTIVHTIINKTKFVICD